MVGKVLSKQTIGHFKAIVFDMDGTLIDSEQVHVDAWKAVLGTYNLSFENEWFEQWIGVSDVALGTRIVNDYSLDIKAEELTQYKRASFRKFASIDLKLIAGVREGLERMKRYPMTIATMSSRADADLSLSATNLTPYFPDIVTSDDVKYHKPHPECYIKASSKLNVYPEQCFAVEDSVSGISAAKQAGCFTIGVANTIRSSFLNEADLVMTNTQDAIKWILAYFERSTS